ncbi:MAG: hypothetical protein KAS48_08240 [Gammaproteobacteria bacterium]|nr:hypothetical protein [Gammaproteobacteria bacterium]
MQKFETIDENMLGMFVDGQLDDINSEFVLKAMENDPAIRESVYQLRRAKDLMKLGFKQAKAPARARVGAMPVRRKIIPGSYSIAASLLILVVSFGGGYLGYTGGQLFSDESARNIVPMSQDKVLLHISESDPKKFMAVLDYARKFLDKHREKGGQVSVVANAGGLDMMREGVSPVKEEVLAMMREYKNMHFIACANSIRALRKKGIEPVILKNIDASKPAMEQIILHVRNGWSYIKVKELPEV